MQTFIWNPCSHCEDSGALEERTHPEDYNWVSNGLLKAGGHDSGELREVNEEF